MGHTSSAYIQFERNCFYYLDVYMNVPTPVANPPRMPLIKLSRKHGIAEMSRPKNITGYREDFNNVYSN